MSSSSSSVDIDELQQLPINHPNTTGNNDDDGNDETDEETPILWSEEGINSDVVETLYSDWTINIQSLDNNDQGTLERRFHVHRIMFGSKSSYFHALFKGNFAEDKEVTLIFPYVVVVENFDPFLEYCYYTKDNFFDLKKREDSFILKPVQSSVLLFLGHYFGMKRLERTCMAYIKNHGFDVNGEYDIDSDYYVYALQLGLSNLRQLLVETCALSLENLKPDSPLSKIVDIDFLIEVLEEAHKEQIRYQENSLRWARNIAFICEWQSSTLKENHFNRLIDSSFLIELDGDVALRFLKLQQEILCRNETVVTELTDLEKRCLHPIHQYFLIQPLRQDNMPDFLPLRVLKELWLLAMWQAKNPWTPGKTLEEPKGNNSTNVYQHHFQGDDCGLFIGACNGMFVVVGNVRGPRPDPGDILFSINGHVVDHESTLEEVLQSIQDALGSTVGAMILFISDLKFRENFFDTRDLKFGTRI
jgi:hypothetical protein